MRYWFLAGSVVLIGRGPLLADGLAYRLPPDGTWVKYKVTIEKYEEWDTRPDVKKGWVIEKGKDPTAKELAEGDIVVVRSVGKQEVNRVPCRWIEMVLNASEEGKKKPEARVIVLKILVPLNAFGKGRDPFEHVKKMYLSDTHDTGDHFLNEIKDRDHQKYEVERFRPYFPIAPKDADRGKAVERKTPAGLLQGHELVFESITRFIDGVTPRTVLRVFVTTPDVFWWIARRASLCGGGSLPFGSLEPRRRDRAGVPLQ